MSKFTPGPWKYSDDSHISIPSTLLATTARDWYRIYNRKQKIGVGLIPDEANARLIAAAPEMYDELYEILQFMQGKTVWERDEYARYAKDIEELLARIDGKEK